MNETLKEHLLSALLTFASVFLTALAVNIGHISVDLVENGTWAAILLAAARGALKIAIQQFLKI